VWCWVVVFLLCRNLSRFAACACVVLSSCVVFCFLVLTRVVLRPACLSLLQFYSVAWNEPPFHETSQNKRKHNKTQHSKTHARAGPKQKLTRKRSGNHMEEEGTSNIVVEKLWKSGERERERERERKRTGP
jgi:hypothetical protein